MVWPGPYSRTRMHVKGRNSAGTDEKRQYMRTIVIVEVVIGEFYCIFKKNFGKNLLQLANLFAMLS